MNGILDLLTDYTFLMIVLGSGLLGLLSGIMGVYVTVRKQGLICDAISHSTLPGVVVMVEVEYDGEGKYALSGDALFREKQRQDRLAALGWRTLRVTKRDLKNPPDLFARVLALMPADLRVHITPRPWMA